MKAHTLNSARGSVLKIRHLDKALVPTAEAPLPSHIPTGGVPKEFAEAAREAVEAASAILRQPTQKLMVMHVPEDYPLTNIYLSRGLVFMGISPALKNPQQAYKRRKRVFSEYNDICWAITFNREKHRAVAEHRVGFRARLVSQK
mgnify:CR=1 FL=1